MGTRGLVCVYHEGRYKVAQYCQWDSYPEGQGTAVLTFLASAFRRDAFLVGLAKTRFADAAEVELMWQEAGKPAGEEWVDGGVAANLKKRYPALSRDTGAGILPIVQAAAGENVAELRLVDNLTFAANGLFCEWTWVIDLDTGTFEGYKGFNSKPLPAGERFAFLNGTTPKHPQEDRQYQPPRKIAGWPLAALPGEAEFLRKLRQGEGLRRKTMAGKKQTITIHAPDADSLERMIAYLTNAFADCKDSGEAPEQAFYELGEVTRSDEASE